MEGTIKRLVHDRGFGLIHAQDGQEVFFDRSNVRQLDFDTLREGLNVQFEIQRSEKGLRGSNVRLSWTEIGRVMIGPPVPCAECQSADPKAARKKMR